MAELIWISRGQPILGHLALPLLLIAGLLGGCATTPVTTSGTPPAGEPTVGEGAAAEPSAAPSDAPGTAPPAVPPRPSTDTATLALLQQSDRAVESGSIDEALSYVERAVRIEPRRADLWTRLASLELSAGNPTTAIQYAQKALTLATDRPDWQRDAWLVIAGAREALGDTAEAAAIRKRWQTAKG
ncbi:MAG: tetratricopeptide repeat protein [Pseudomonadales bacterium]